MKRVFSLLLVLGCLFGLCLPAYAVDDGQDSSFPSEPEPSVPTVALDDSSIQAIVDALVPSEPAGDDLSDDTEPTIPVVDLTPDTVDAISQAVGASVSDALAQAAADSEDSLVAYSSSGISGGYYFVCDCALGSNVKFWVPSDFASGSLALDNGGIVNMTNNSVYLMPDDSSLSSYTIYASRFNHFQYRRSGYDYSDLNIRNISDTNISFLSGTSRAIPEQTLFIVLIAVILLGVLLLAFIKR